MSRPCFPPAFLLRAARLHPWVTPVRVQVTALADAGHAGVAALRGH